MILLVALIIIWATYKFFKSWFWWVLLLFFLIQALNIVWKFLTWGPVAIIVCFVVGFIVLNTAVYYAVMWYQKKHPTPHIDKQK